MAQLTRPPPPPAFKAALALVAVLGVFDVVPAQARIACLPYEPAEATVSGRLAHGDDEKPSDAAPARYRLRLERPLCTLAGSGLPGEEGVRTVELVFPRGAPPMRPLLDRRLAASGSLFRTPDGRVRLTVTGLGRAR